jgi:hypothetical protein
MEIVFLSLVIAFPVVLLLVLPGVIIVIVIRQERHEKALGNHLRLQGMSTTGQIVKHRVEKIGRSCQRYLAYQYIFEDTKHEYEQWVNVEGFNSVRDGETVEILFLPEDPSTPRLAPIDRFQWR